MKRTTIYILTLLSLSGLFFSSCDAIDVIQGIGKIKKYRDAKNVEFSEVDEYFIGRKILASFLAKRQPSFDRKLSDYLNAVGQTLVVVSQRPDIWNGYRFIAYRSPYMGAYSLPGGYILISTGMLRKCSNEDQLAAVLGHELGHARWRHPLEAVKKKMVTRAKQDMVAFFASRSKSGMVQLFAVAGIINWENQLNRYSRTQELEADVYSCWLMMKAGYNPYQMLKMLRKIPGGRSRYSKYHPSINRRIQVVRKEIGRYKGVPVFLKSREDRYKREVIDHLNNLRDNRDRGFGDSDLPGKNGDDKDTDRDRDNGGKDSDRDRDDNSRDSDRDSEEG